MSREDDLYEDGLPEPIGDFVQWVRRSTHYSWLWRWMSSGRAQYSPEDFKQDLVTVWLESGEVVPTGDTIVDARNRGLFRVLDRIAHRVRKQLPKQASLDASEPGGDSWVEQIPGPDPVIHHDELPALAGPRSLARRTIIRRLAELPVSLGPDGTDLGDLISRPSACPDPSSPQRGGLHISLARRNWRHRTTRCAQG